MDKNEALNFLKENQPLPNDKELNEKSLEKYDNVRKFFLENPCEECIPLFLNSFGGMDGLGVYQLIEDVIRQFNSDIVIPYLNKALESKIETVQYWCTQIAACFPNKCLINNLTYIAENGFEDAKMFAILALSKINEPKITDILKKLKEKESNIEIIEIIEDTLLELKG